MSLSMIRPFDRDALRRQFQEAKPFPFIAIDRFLDPESAREVAASYPAYAEARGRGREFSAINEKEKVQITLLAHWAHSEVRITRY
jgi:hypothetical protein